MSPLAAVLGWNVEVRQHAGLAFVDERAQLAPFLPRFVADRTERLPGACVKGRMSAWPFVL